MVHTHLKCQIPCYGYLASLQKPLLDCILRQFKLLQMFTTYIPTIHRFILILPSKLTLLEDLCYIYQPIFYIPFLPCIRLHINGWKM
jgi:hypothetical protein